MTKHFVVFDINLSLHLYASRFCWTQNRIGPTRAQINLIFVKPIKRWTNHLK